MIEVYHGGVERIEKPLAKVGRDNLDFGKGFYVQLNAQTRPHRTAGARS